MQPIDFFWKILEIAAIVIGGIVAFVRIMTKVAQIEIQVKSDIVNMKEKMQQYERQDEKIMGKLDEISDRMNDFQLLEVEVKNSRDKITQLERQHEKIMGKLDEISGQMNTMNINLQNKENRK